MVKQMVNLQHGFSMVKQNYHSFHKKNIKESVIVFLSFLYRGQKGGEQEEDKEEKDEDKEEQEERREKDKAWWGEGGF